MNARVHRWVLLILAMSAAYVGGWGAVAPRSFYDSFPGFGRHWVMVDGPYNEHLVRDVGTLYLALLALSVGAALRPGLGYLVRVTGAAWLVFSIPHLAYHADHLGMYDAVDRTLNVVTLGGTIVLAGLLLIPADGTTERTVS